MIETMLSVLVCFAGVMLVLHGTHAKIELFSWDTLIVLVGFTLVGVASFIII